MCQTGDDRTINELLTLRLSCSTRARRSWPEIENGERIGNRWSSRPTEQTEEKARARAPSECNTGASSGHAIRTGCQKANIPHWHPHQLRHNAATWLRKEFGLDIARVILGHHSSDVTEISADLDFSRAVEVVGKVG